MDYGERMESIILSLLGFNSLILIAMFFKAINKEMDKIGPAVVKSTGPGIFRREKLKKKPIYNDEQKELAAEQEELRTRPPML